MISAISLKINNRLTKRLIDFGPFYLNRVLRDLSDSMYFNVV